MRTDIRTVIDVTHASDSPPHSIPEAPLGTDSAPLFKHAALWLVLPPRLVSPFQTVLLWLLLLLLQLPSADDCRAGDARP